MYSLSSPGALRRVPPSLALIAGLHLLAIWALVNGLHVRIGPPPPPAITGSVIDTPAPPPELFTPRGPTLAPTTVKLEETPPPVVGPIAEEPPPTIIETLPPPLGVPGATASIPMPVVVDAAVDPRRPLTQPAYPMASIRGNEEGALSLAVLVGTDGRVHDAKVAHSSGSDRLDQAAVSEAKARWHLRPATRDGRPFEQWLTLRVVFRLESR